MSVSHLADKLISALYKDFLETGKEVWSAQACVEMFPKQPVHIVHAAIRKLDHDGLLTVLYGDNAPVNVGLKAAAVENHDENTLIKKGYRVLKEIRDWLPDPR